MSDISQLLDNARAFLGLTREEARRALGGTVHTVEDDEYGQMSNLTTLEAPSGFPGTLYVKDEVVELIRIGYDHLATTPPATLQASLPGPGVRLASRAGKTAHLAVYAEQGIAYSYHGDRIHFLEIFRPCSQRAYQARIYHRPPDFIR